MTTKSTPTKSSGNRPPTSDHKAPQPRKTNTVKAAALDSLTVEFNGQTYDITRSRMDNLEIFELVEDNKAISASREFLGPEQWSRFKEKNRVDGRVSMTTFNEFLDSIMKAVGGNSSASAGS